MLDEYFDKNYDRILQYLRQSKYKMTAKALERFYLKNTSISKLIQSIDYENDFYPVFILIRSQIEHFIVNLYIWLKFTIDENDSAAEKYYLDYTAQEFVKKINYNKDNKIIHSSRYAVLLSEILDGLKSRGLLKQKHIERLNVSANQFDIRKISKFINEKIPENATPFFKKQRVKEMLEQYNYLCSSVHGGPTSDIAYFDSADDKLKESALEYKDWSLRILSLHRFYIIYFLAHEFEDIKVEMQKEVEKLRVADEGSTKPNKRS
jgi:hypothetical protein